MTRSRSGARRALSADVEGDCARHRVHGEVAGNQEGQDGVPDPRVHPAGSSAAPAQERNHDDCGKCRPQEEGVPPHVRCEKRRHDQVRLAGDERFSPAAPAVRLVHEPGDAARVPEGFQRVTDRVVLRDALRCKVADLLFEVRGKLADDPALGTGIEMQVSLDFAEVAADLRSHDGSFSPPWAS